MGHDSILCISHGYRSLYRILVTDSYHILIINFPLIMEIMVETVLDL